MPKSLHAELVALAEAEGVSLNQLAVSALARMAARAAEDKAPRAESVSPYEAIDRLDHTEQLLQLLLSRFQELNGERLPELEEVVHDLEDELADERSPVGKLLAGLKVGASTDVASSPPFEDDLARQERIRRRSKARRRPNKA